MFQGVGPRSAEVLALTTFAVASPLLAVLGDQPVFLVAHDLIGWRLVLLVIGVFTVPALLLLTVDVALVSMIGRPTLARAISSGVLIGTILLQPLRAIAPGGPWMTSLFLLLLGSFGAWAYLRWDHVKSVLRMGALTSLVFAGVFLFASPAATLLEDFDPEVSSSASAEEISVVLVVFDQLPLSLLVDMEGEIETSRYPNFGRLSEISTWYRNAVTVSSETALAVPAILTGRVPNEVGLPVVSQHPENLFTVLGNTHSIQAYETFTQLCPDSLCRQEGQLADGVLVGDLAVVLVRALVDDETADHLVPEFGTAWAGFTVEAEATNMQEAIDARIRGDDRTRVDQFLAGLSAVDPPGLHYLHLEKPHEPLLFLPDGRRYDYCNCYSVDEQRRWPASPLTSQRLQRYVLQTMYVDTVLGEILDRLETSPSWDQTMVVVLSDHGAGLLPGMTNRILNGDNAPDILPVPLFVKMPNQADGDVELREVQIVDVLPTILQVLGLDTMTALDGRSLTEAVPQNRSLVFVGNGLRQSLDEKVTVDESRLPAFLADFFSEPGNPYAIGPTASLYGTRVEDGTTGMSDLEVDLATHRVLAATQTTDVPAHVIGRVVNGGEPTSVVVTIDGFVAGMGSTFQNEDTWWLSIMVDPAFVKENSIVGVFEVRGDSLLEVGLS